MQAPTDSTISHLNHLIETCKDGQEGFRAAANNVKDSAYTSFFVEFAAERARFATELQEFVRSFGEGAEKTSSISGALHRGWIDLKAALTSGDEHAVLAECERGEDFAVAAYREALEDTELSAGARAIIQRQATAIQRAHDRVRDLRDAVKH
jgi:uncharacterized protein (TIGR02284 family)